MTLETARNMAKKDLKDWNCEGYVIIKADYTCFYGNDPLMFYDYVLFSSWEDMQKYLNGKVSYDYIDETAYLRDDEEVIEAYHINKIIIV